ncbi:MAG: phosphate signaling complex protein PhoU [SAR202 cluster bacterium]|jgi:phosphate transport system protein|nr:phosphate signaling complex protein PhoU [SAR202 cluster bacterium]MDP6514159.1 phosphate signaling complex protein PhoU [SAR202 cluster bacterium]MDP6713365.1 phosphate signaling complex protein PhoU [SAR202 cluster bacterium]
MPRTDFDKDLRLLQDELLQLGGMVEKAIERAVDALKRRDLRAAEEVVEDDDIIDQKRFDLEERCIDLIATQQPLAGDLRILITTLHMSVELERIGDYAEGIAKICILMGNEPPLKPLIDIPRMAEKANDMLRRSLDAFVNRDVIAANVVCSDDDEVDALYDQVYRELLTYMMADPGAIRRATYLLWVAHDLERIADRTTNIAERVIYMVTGKLSDADREAVTSGIVTHNPTRTD